MDNFFNDFTSAKYRIVQNKLVMIQLKSETQSIP